MHIRLAMLVGLLGAAGCANLQGLSGGNTDGGGDGGSRTDVTTTSDARDGAPDGHMTRGDAGPSSDANRPDSPDAALPDNVIYVDATGGNDSNGGRVPSAPFRTIGAAVAAAQPGDEIHACVGNYVLTSTLVLSNNFILRGGYACGTYARASLDGTPAPMVATTTEDVPTLPTNATTIQGDITPVVQITGNTVPASSLLEGVTIAGASTVLSSTAIGLEVESAATRLFHDVIIGGTGFQPGTKTSTYDGAYGLHVIGDGANPEIGWCFIHGGVASSHSGNGTYGIRIDGATTDRTEASVHDNVIHAGQGVSDIHYGAIGMQVINVNGPWAAPITHNVITGGYGSTQNANAQATNALVLYLVENPPPASVPNAIDVIENTINGGIATSPQGTTPDAGTFIATSALGVLIQYGEVRILGNRIDPGDVSRVYGTGLLSAIDNEVASTASMLIAGNMVLVGDMAAPPTSYVIVPVTLDGPTTFVDNTVVAVDPTSATQTAAAGLVSIVGTLSTLTTVENNLLVNAAGTNLFGVTFPASNAPSSFQNNAFVNVSLVSCVGPCLTYEASPAGSPTQATIPAFESAAAAQAGGSGSHNFRVAATCDPSEVPTAGRRTCLVDSTCGTGGANDCIRDNSISPFTDPSGTPEFLSDAGWALGANAACEIARGGLWLGDAGAPVDVTGTAWSDLDAGFSASGMTVGAVNDPRGCL